MLQDDHFYTLHKRRCMNFVRSQAGLRYNCRLGPREQFNEISAVLDAGTVYRSVTHQENSVEKFFNSFSANNPYFTLLSNVPERQESLRLYKKGFLKTLPVFSEFNMRDLLPLKLEEPDEVRRENCWTHYF